MATSMGITWYTKDAILKRKFRWTFSIIDVTNIVDSAKGSINALPPNKANRPILEFREMEVQHLNEIIYYPAKPDWRPITLTLYDLKTNKNPVFAWLKTIYNPETGTWNVDASLKKNATLKMLDGCGNAVETWTLENAWPQTINFGELDMGSSDVALVEVTLRYDRAFITGEPE
jgi:phage tail-like protein